MRVFAPDAVPESPFASEGHVHRFEGREAIATFMREMVSAGRLRFGSYDFRVRETGDEDVGHHQRIADGALGDVCLITLRDVLVGDYVDPLQPPAGQP